MDFFKTHFARIFYINQSVPGAFIIHLNIVVMCSKLTVRTPEWHQMTFLNVFLVYLLYNIKTFNISKHQTIALNIFKSWHQNDLAMTLHCWIVFCCCLFVFCFFFVNFEQFPTINLLLLLYSEPVVRKCSVRKVFSEISQNSQENTCARFSFLMMLQALGLLSISYLAKCLSVDAFKVGKTSETFFLSYQFF